MGRSQVDMMESIYGYEKQTGKAKNVHIKIPKNIKQIGHIQGELVVYMEDYVRIYLQQFAEYDFSELSSAILIGAYQKSEEEQNLFIRGAVRTESLMQGKELCFTESIWGGVYEKIQQFFPDEEIVGWFCGGLNLPPCDMEIMKQIHLDNFPGKEKVLFFYDPLDKEECFYRFEQNCLAVQQGYYVYYEKNDAMQEYMVAYPLPDKEQKKEVVNNTPPKEAITEEQKAEPVNYKFLKKSDKKKKKVFRLAYASLTLMILVALAVAAGIKKEDTKEKIPQFAGEEGEEDSTMTWITAAPEKPSKAESEKQDIVVPTELLKEETIQPKEDKEPTMTPELTKEAVQKKQESKESETYVVQMGDTLASISRKKYGNANRIQEIYELNNMDDRDFIYVGQKLLLPVD